MYLVTVGKFTNQAGHTQRSILSVQQMALHHRHQDEPAETLKQILLSNIAHKPVNTVAIPILNSAELLLYLYPIYLLRYNRFTLGRD